MWALRSSKKLKSLIETMVKCLKAGKVVVITSGKYAGKKAVIVKVNEEATDKYKFPHAIVVGVESAPRKVTRAMDEKTVNKKTSMKVFTKVINLQHFMPTRYNVEFKFENLPKASAPAADKKEAMKAIAKMFQESYIHQDKNEKERTKAGVAYLFKKLYF
ncbi:hypothetical protein WA556_004516 [Blastocystis sp. ATCC 50177/Nand II]